MAYFVIGARGVVADFHIGRIYQPVTSLAGGGCQFDLRIAMYFYDSARGFNKTTVTAVRSGDVERAVYVHGAAVKPAQQHNFAVLLLQGARFNYAGVIHYGLQ